MSAKQNVARGRRRWNLTDAIYKRLGHDEWGDGQPSPPGQGLGIRVGPQESSADEMSEPIYVVLTQNDGFELWIGSDEEWHWHCRADEARKVAWFVLWTWWARGTWFGLRRRLWYWALHRINDRSRLLPPAGTGRRA